MTKRIGQRQTAQREAILDVITEAEGPLSVPEILEIAEKRVPNLGVATVYRAVKLLGESGHIRAVSLPDDQLRYEAANLGHHHHFRCLDCDRVYDIPGCIISIQDGTELPNGFHVRDHEVTLLGTCKYCGESK